MTGTTSIHAAQHAAGAVRSAACKPNPPYMAGKDASDQACTASACGTPHKHMLRGRQVGLNVRSHDGRVPVWPATVLSARHLRPACWHGASRNLGRCDPSGDRCLT